MLSALRIRIGPALAAWLLTGCPDVTPAVVSTESDGGSGTTTGSAPDDDGGPGPGTSAEGPVDTTGGGDGTAAASTDTGQGTGTTGGDDTTGADSSSDGSTGDGSSSSDGVVDSVCGDATIEGLEECDLDQLDGQDCASLGFTGGELACNRDCLFEISGCFNAACGNGIIEGLEPCDGEALGDDDCIASGFDQGEIACAEDCTYDTSGCSFFVCGNDVLEGDEVCDIDQLSGNNCITQGFDVGTLACLEDCTDYDTTGCDDYVGNCCNINGSVGCEDDTCWQLVCGADSFCCNNFWDGACANAAIAQCEVCAVCGNNVLNVNETCDGSALPDDCVDLGFGGGTVSCEGDCEGYDTSACYDGLCCAGNNGTPGCVDEACVNEICAQDSFCCTNFWDQACSNQANNQCAVCGVVCGDGSVDGSEDCDMGNLDGTDCEDLPGFNGGTLSCNADCTFNTSACESPPSWSNDIQPIWNTSCGCHVAMATPPTFSGVTPAVSYANLVNVASGQVPGTDYIEPGDSTDSYIIHKLEGTQAVGLQMPWMGTPLPPATIAIIAEWIDAGAPNN
ncbi:MAG: hypothetical protein AAF721_21350 [Myxococcota bacterium]